MSKLLDGLNPAQREAVKHKDGPLLIIAGPGSGKTETVARSIAYAIEKREVGPSRIAAFTFTNKAKDDLKKRISDNIVRQDLVNHIWIRTFHSFCGHVWNNHPGKLVIENARDFTAKELTRVYRAQITHLQYHQFDDKEIFNFIREYENQDISLTKVGNLQVPQIYIDIHKKYTQILKDNNDIYTKIQLFTNALLRDVHEVKTEWQEKFELIFVDEFQDTDPIQYQIIKTLAGPRQNLRVVGDDDQGIYGWRGADIQNILNFQNDYPTAKKPITLGQNYRSTQKIVEASRALVEFNPDRREKDLFTKNFKGEKVKYLHCENADVEANTIADFINRAIQEGQNPSDFAVLYRKKAQAHTLEEAFSNRTPKIRYYNLDKEGNLLSKQPKCTVSLMTIHKSKGLEFPNVFVSGVCSGLLPLYKSKKDWDEELRLLYVAMTRAENWLCLSSYEPHGRSEFLSYIPSSLLKTIEPLDNIRIPPKPEKMERPVTKESSDYEQLPEKLLGAGMTVIGIDPGNVGARKTNVGWSVTQKTSDGYSVLDYNTEHPIGKKEDKLKEIERKINSLVTFPPDAIDAIDAIAVEKIEVAIGEVEDTIEKAKAKWFHYVASCVATIRNIADRHGIECRLYTAQDVKYAATDNRSANKEQVESGVKKRCSVLMVKNNKKIDDHSADAIAASLCYLRSHLNSSRFEGNKRKQKHWNKGYAYLDKSQYEAAISEFTEAINIDPIYVDAHCGLGRVYLAQGHLEETKNAAKKALSLAENSHSDSQKVLDAIKHYRLGCNAVDNKQFDEAIVKFRESINLERIFPEAHCELSRAYLGAGNPKAAKDAAVEALRLRDDYPPARNLLNAINFYHTGLNFLNNQLYDEATNRFKKAIDREPIFTAAHYRLGYAHFQNRAPEAAEQSANHTLELNINYQLAHALLDEIKKAYVDKGYGALERLDLIEAEQYRNKALQIDEYYQPAYELFESIKKAYYKQAYDYLNDKQYDYAISEFNKLINKDPNFVDAYCGLGCSYFKRGNLKAAENYAKEALKLEDNYQPALQVLEDIKQAYVNKCKDYLKQDELVAAERSAKEARRLDPNCQETDVLLATIKQAYYNRGCDHLENQRYDEAITAFEESINRDPKFTAAHCGLGQSYLGIGNLTKAADSAQKALRLDPYYQPALNLLEDIKQTYYNQGCDHLDNQRYDEAIHIFTKTKNKYPDFTEAHYKLAQTYLEQADNLAAAEESIKETLRLAPYYRPAHALLEDIKQEYYNRSNAHIEVGEYRRAIDLLLRVDDIDRNNKEVCTNLADVYCLTGDDANAARWYQKVIDIDPNDKIAYIELGNAYYNMGKYEKSVDSFEKARKLDPHCEKTYDYWKRADFKLQKDKEMKADRMIRIPAEKFQMKSKDRESKDCENLEYTVYVDEFYIDAYLVTNAEYKVFVDKNPEWQKSCISNRYHRGDYLMDWNGNNYPQGKDNHPVTYVNWYAAMAYALWIGKRLPTEVEREKAAREFGNTVLVGNHSPDNTNSVWEWCLDEYNSNPCRSFSCPNLIVSTDNTSEIINYFKNVTTQRVLRSDDGIHRRGNTPSFTNHHYGFRCVKSVTG